MKPAQKLATARTPNGSEMALYRRDRDYAIRVDGYELMNSRRHESELELARLGCAHVAAHPAPCVLVGGLGLGYTLREALGILGARAEIVVAELLQAVVDWNRDLLGDLNGHALADARVRVEVESVLAVMVRETARFDAILLDVDNGPQGMTDSGNNTLYSPRGIEACRRALRDQGCLAVWSAEADKPFEQRLVRGGFRVRRFRVPAYKGSKSIGCFVWVASENEDRLPAGGGEPRLPTRRAAPHHRRRPFRRR